MSWHTACDTTKHSFYSIATQANLEITLNLLPIFIQTCSNMSFIKIGKILNASDNVKAWIRSLLGV